MSSKVFILTVLSFFLISCKNKPENKIEKFNIEQAYQKYFNFLQGCKPYDTFQYENQKLYFINFRDSVFTGDSPCNYVAFDSLGNCISIFTPSLLHTATGLHNFDSYGGNFEVYDLGVYKRAKFHITEIEKVINYLYLNKAETLRLIDFLMRLFQSGTLVPENQCVQYCKFNTKEEVEKVYNERQKYKEDKGLYSSNNLFRNKLFDEWYYNYLIQNFDNNLLVYYNQYSFDKIISYELITPELYTEDTPREFTLKNKKMNYYLIHFMPFKP